MIELDDTPEKQNWLHVEESKGPPPVPAAQRRTDQARSEFVEAAKQVISAYETSKKAAALRPLEEPLTKKIYRALQLLRKKILSAAPLAEASGPGEAILKDAPLFQRIWDMIKDPQTFKDFDEHINQTYSETNKAFAEGWENGKEPLVGQEPNLAASFGMMRPDVLRAATLPRIAARVTNVGETVKEDIRQLLLASRAEGSSYAEFRRTLAGSFTFSRDRAQLIAVTELADAYEEGNSAPSKMLSNAGFNMQKSWLLLSDEKTCERCQENAAVGWIPEDQEFPYGGDHPPAHPRCRCAADRRMDPESNMSIPEPTTPGAETAGYRDFEEDTTGMETWAYGDPHEPQYTASGALVISTQPRATGGVYGPWSQSLLDEEVEAIRSYTSSGYDSINKTLAGMDPGYDMDFEDDNAIWDVIHSLEGALSSAPPLPEDIITYRGVGGDLVKGVKIGDTVEYPIFASTSLSNEIALQFADNARPFNARSDPASAVIYKLLVPKGTKDAAYLGNTLGMSGEREFLFSPNTSWRVISDRITSGLLQGRETAYRELTMEPWEPTAPVIDVTGEVMEGGALTEAVRESSTKKFTDQPGQFRVRRPLPR